jgi:hypothetical protein
MRGVKRHVDPKLVICAARGCMSATHVGSRPCRSKKFSVGKPRSRLHLAHAKYRAGHAHVPDTVARADVIVAR